MSYLCELTLVPGCLVHFTNTRSQKCCFFHFDCVHSVVSRVHAVFLVKKVLEIDLSCTKHLL